MTTEILEEKSGCILLSFRLFLLTAAGCLATAAAATAAAFMGAVEYIFDPREMHRGYSILRDEHSLKNT